MHAIAMSFSMVADKAILAVDESTSGKGTRDWEHSALKSQRAQEHGMGLHMWAFNSLVANSGEALELVGRSSPGHSALITSE